MEYQRSKCPVNMAVEVIGDKWTLLIIRDIMFNGKRHFRELLASEEKIASNILTDRLAMLEDQGIITKKQDPDHKQKLIYSLTAKGVDLLPIIKEVGAWSFKYKSVDLKKYSHAKMLAEANPKVVESIKHQISKEQMGK
jgi:DNA-binding HxlR family transcriptional regulator